MKTFTERDRRAAYGRGYADGQKKCLSKAIPDKKALLQAWNEGYTLGLKHGKPPEEYVSYNRFSYLLTYTLTAMLESKSTSGNFLLHRFLVQLKNIMNSKDPCGLLMAFTASYHWEKEQNDKARRNAI